MPSRDGTGPMGQGPGSGRGWGFCTGRFSSEEFPVGRGRRGARGQGFFGRRRGRVGDLQEASRLEKILARLKRRQRQGGN